MIRINLLPLKETQRAIGQRQQISVALLSLSIALLIMVVPYVMQGRQLTRLDDQIATLQTEIKKLTEQTREARDLEKNKKELQAKLKVIEDLDHKRIGPVHVLEALSEAAPEKLWLIDFNEVGGVATITGMALDNQTIALFMRQLSQSSYFVNVDLVEAAQTPSTGRSSDSPTAGFQRFIIKSGIDYIGRGGKSDQEQPSDGKAASGAEKNVKAAAAPH